VIEGGKKFLRRKLSSRFGHTPVGIFFEFSLKFLVMKIAARPFALLPAGRSTQDLSN
jgi:hypothetical protein